MNDVDIIKKNLKTPEFKNAMEQYVREMIEKRNQTKEFINTDEFKNNFTDLKVFLAENDGFCTDGVYYTETEDEIIFADKAIKIFETVDQNTDTHETDKKASFPTTNMYYDGVGMSVTMGQGSFFKFWMLPS